MINMCKKLISGIVFFRLTLIMAKEAELPLCPTNVLYFPQNLPMHCRMPTNADFRGLPGQTPNAPGKPPPPMSIPVPPGFPGPISMPGPMHMPGPMPMSGSMHMLGPFPAPGPMPFPGPMPMPMSHPGGPAHKLPVIVMPYYSPDTSFKKTGQRLPSGPNKRRKWKTRHRRRRPIYPSTDTSSDTDTDTSSDTSSSSSSEYKGWWNGRKNPRRFNGSSKMRRRKNNKKRELLTPVLQYITKDGYVIFEKKISNNEANDWLSVRKEEKIEISTRISPEIRDMESNERNDNRSRDKEMVREENVEVITNRSPHKLNRIKAHRNKAARHKLSERQL